MADYIIDKDGNKRDKNGQIIGSTQTTTIEPTDEASKAAKRSKSNIWGDIKKAITANQAGGLGNAGASTATPVTQQKIEDQKVINEISEQAGVPLKSMPENAPVYSEQVKEYLKDPGNYDEATAKEKAALENEAEKPEMTPTEVVQPEALGDNVEPTVQSDKQPGSETVQPEGQLPKAPEEANVDFSDYINNYYGPKNGADYLKSLWSQGKEGKAQAIGNVLGNLLGQAGTINVAGAQGSGSDYKSDWQTYKDNYQKEMADRNQKAFDQNMDISHQLRTNEVARNELVKALDNYEKIGKNLDPEKFENIRKALTATGKNGQMEYYLASALGELTSDPDFMNAVKEAGGNAAELLGNLTKFGANTLKPVNYIFGGVQ